MGTGTLESTSEQTSDRLEWWTNLRHGGLLLDGPRLSELLSEDPAELNSYEQDRFRRRINQFVDNPDAHRGQLISFVLESICEFDSTRGTWFREGNVSKDWSRKTLTGESIRPNHLWIGTHESLLPVFIEKEKRVGIGRGKKLVSNALQWLRQTGNRLALISNGHEWRLLFAGLDYEAYVQWDLNQWFTDGEPSDLLRGFRSLVCPDLWTVKTKDSSPLLLSAINESRKGQAELSQVLGERVRQAVELLVQGNAAAINKLLVSEQDGDSQPIGNADIYRAGVRFVMRMVVVLFAESRERLLPRDNPTYHDSYSLGGLRDQLLRQSPHRQRNNFAAFPRILSLFRLIYEGSPHPDLTISQYGGDLFRPGDANSTDGMIRALHIFENGCYSHDVMSDAQVAAILDLLSRTKIKIRQGRTSTWIPSPVDFSSLDSEYIGILYEGLLDFELRQAADDDPIVFLAVGNQPALPLATLEAMDDKALKNLLNKMKDTSSGEDDEEADEDTEDDDQPATDDSDGEDDDDQGDQADADLIVEDLGTYDVRKTMRARAESWAHRAIATGKLVNKPRGKMTEEKKLAYQAAIDRKASQIVTRVVLPGEWYLVRWGGTRKGSGTFYTRPQLAIPTVHRTLFPLAYEANEDGEQQANTDQPPIPKLPEEILNLKVCDPACGSGSFPLAALRFLTDALFASLHYHNRIEYFSDRTVIDLIRDKKNEQTLAGEALPCRPEDIDFEPRTKAVLRRYVVERCIYGVDLDPLAVELCRLSLWIETLDPRLPFTFLDHKIKCGNALIGTWFDQLMHYPPMAWMREGGDKNHSNGVHFKKEAWTKAISAALSSIKDELKIQIDEQVYMFTDEDLDTVQTIHNDAEKALQQIHALGVHEADRRAARYRELRESQAFIDAKFSLDLWCSIWFWPPELLDDCPRVKEFYEGKLSSDAKIVVNQLAAEMRFFHWQLEFPDVFGASSDGFDAAIGNPPWDIAKPNSKEFFSALDPLYRSYGKQEAIRKQTDKFERDVEVERRWLSYNATFRAQSNWVKYSGSPYGKRVLTDSRGKQKHQLNLGDGGRNSFETSTHRHEKWEDNRESQTGYSRELENERGYQYQGGGDINLYKMFLERSHAIARQNGRLGLIVPSGIYSDYGTGNLRLLFLESCRWQWLFGFENREGIFDIHRSFKFNPVIVEKGGKTSTIRTAFMRRNLDDWESGEEFVTEYPLKRVLQFSPRSRAILEIQSQRDLEVLENVYSNSVLLGDEGPGSWGITYSTEFHMTNDSKLFPSRDKWEESGYRPDEYSRWLKGNWQPRTADCTAPPGCTRVSVPEGIVLSRDGNSWMHEDEVDTAEFKDKSNKKHKGNAIGLPLYQGSMIWHFDFAFNTYVQGAGNRSSWARLSWPKKDICPQFLLPKQFSVSRNKSRWLFRDISNATNRRSFVSSLSLPFPSGNKTPTLTSHGNELESLILSTLASSLVFDWAVRVRMTGTTLNYFIVAELPLVRNKKLVRYLLGPAAQLCLGHSAMAPVALRLESFSVFQPDRLAFTEHERLRLQCICDAISSYCFGITSSEFSHIVFQCDLPVEILSSGGKFLNPKGFWRIDKTKMPELRQTVLALTCLNDLEEHLGSGGDVASFLSQNDGEGWQLPTRLRLADYGLGCDDRAREYQPVRECFGPRFYDWQLEQTPEESWRECHLHARNLLGPDGYQALLDELDGKTPPTTSTNSNSSKSKSSQGQLDDTEILPLFDGDKNG